MVSYRLGIFEPHLNGEMKVCSDGYVPLTKFLQIIITRSHVSDFIKGCSIISCFSSVNLFFVNQSLKKEQIARVIYDSVPVK